MSNPIYQFAADSPSPCWFDVSKESHDEYTARSGWLTRIVYAAPVVERQEPVSVVLPARIIGPNYEYVAGFNACLDKVKELNP